MDTACKSEYDPEVLKRLPLWAQELLKALDAEQPVLKPKSAKKKPDLLDKFPNDLM